MPSWEGLCFWLGTSAPAPLQWTFGGGGNPELCVCVGEGSLAQPRGPAWVTPCTYSNGSLGSAFCSSGGIGIRL